MKKIILIMMFSMILLSNALALTTPEAQKYVGKFCYIKYYHFESNDIEVYDKVLGKIFDIIEDNGYKFVVVDYKGEVYYISINRVINIQLIRQ